MCFHTLLFYWYRHSLFKSHFLNGEDAETSYYRKYSNKLTKIIAMSKKFYFTNQLDLNKNNPTKTWSILQSG